MSDEIKHELVQLFLARLLEAERERLTGELQFRLQMQDGGVRSRRTVKEYVEKLSCQRGS